MDETWEDLGIEIPFGRTGSIKTLCPQCSPNRRHLRDKCLSVDIERGLYHCHNCGWKGRLNSGNSFGGFTARARPERIYVRPTPPPQNRISAKALEFVVERGIDPDLLSKHGITADETTIKFPYKRDGELINVKTRYYPDKRFVMEKDCELIFWGLDECEDAEQLIIVEGEFDKLALETVGLPHVLCVPNGASSGSMNYLASAEHIFANVNVVILAGDADEAGQKLIEELARRIGKERCYRVTWPDGCKDANDVLLQHGDVTLRKAIADARSFPIPGVISASEVRLDAENFYEHGREPGIAVGWDGLDELYTVKSGELTVMTGYPGSGKSEWLDALALNLTKEQGWTFGIFAAEDGGSLDHFSRLAEKYHDKPFKSGPTERMSWGEFTDFLDWVEDRIQFIVPDYPDLETILELARLLVFRIGIKGLIIDPWNQLEHARPSGFSETEYVSLCLGQIKRFALLYGLHIWVTAHPKKPYQDKDGAIPVPTPYDISGSANWYNKADNCLTIFRNKDHQDEPVQLFVQKIRFRENGSLGNASLHYDRVTGCYRDVRTNFS